MSKTIDLDSARAARAEVAEDVEAPKLHFNGVEFDLPLELPFGAFLRMAASAKTLKDQGAESVDPMESMQAMDALIGTLFGERKNEFLDLGPSMADLTTMLEALMDVYSLDVGKA